MMMDEEYDGVESLGARPVFCGNLSPLNEPDDLLEVLTSEVYDGGKIMGWAGYAAAAGSAPTS